MTETSAPPRQGFARARVTAVRRARALGAAGLVALALACHAETEPSDASAHAPQARDAPGAPPVRQAKPEQTETPVDGGIVSRIVGLERLRSGDWRIRLENGQVWQQRDGERLPLREGYDVRIYESRLGGYRLEAEPTRGFIDVERVQ